MRYSDSSELSKVSLLSYTLLIFLAGIVEVVNPYPVKANSIRIVDDIPSLFLAQANPPASPAATPQATASPVSSEPSNRGGGNATLWWLLLLCLGLPFVLVWLANQTKTNPAKPSTLILTPETGNTARIYWELSPEKIQELRRRGGTNLLIRLMEVTNINPLGTNPEVVQQVSCSLGSPLVSLQVPEVDRQYQAELGCMTRDGDWISLAKSAPAYFPTPRPFLGGLGAGIVTAIGSTEISSLEASPVEAQKVETQKIETQKVETQKVETQKVETQPDTKNKSQEIVPSPVLLVTPPVTSDSEIVESASQDVFDPEAQPSEEVNTQIQLDRHPPDQGYVVWTIAPKDHQALQSQGVNNWKLRIYDVTNIDLDQTPAHDTQEYNCEMDQRDCYVPISVGDRPYADYIAELGAISNNGEWLRIIRSLHTRFSS